MITDIQAKILKLLLKYRFLNRYELVIKSNIPRSTLYDNLEKLLNMNYINRIKQKRKSVGRPSIVWFIKNNMLDIIKQKGFFDNSKFIN